MASLAEVGPYSVFVDTSAWAGLFLPREGRHVQASACMERLLLSARLYSSDYVFTELVTLMGARAGFGAAWKAGEALRRHPTLFVLEVTPEIREEAWRLFRKYRDQEASFVDCTSFALITRNRIAKVFAYDRHFRLLGRVIVG